ncbi:hypothetical protein WICMUC_005413 [Wickerhamomyces mucosus]|uniref:Major facilitator superfamily (MFS) profile domain-containing protein n=1 Tax=Wickerhamomyces mucosus TaxID=1378264 RepID=A0A9P8T5R8_9ASCO|nr:hypothetical protein WICMUC_005413 [Wickerhamomyces mucosus]
MDDFSYTRLGDYIGTLGSYDEILAIVLCPLLGALSDKIGPKYISIFGVFIMGISFFLYTTAKNVYPDLLFFRLLFAIGASASASMMTALLAEISSSGFKLESFFNLKTINYTSINESDLESDYILKIKPNGKLTSVIGISSGLGAIFAVSVYLPLPIKFEKRGESSLEALIHSYFIVGIVALFTSLILAFTLYSKKTSKLSIDSNLISSNEIIDSEKNYIELLKLGFQEGIKDHRISLAYLGAFVARSMTVANTVFIPLWIYNYFLETGKCSIPQNGSSDLIKDSCRDAYINAAILVGIINTIALIMAPLIGVLTDRLGNKKSIKLVSFLGSIGSIGFALIEDPTRPLTFFFGIFIGTAQIGLIITSMSLATDKDRRYNGAISGVYGLFGGLGILIISKLGGYLSDFWQGSVFFILGLFNVVLLGFSHLVDAETQK